MRGMRGRRDWTRKGRARERGKERRETGAKEMDDGGMHSASFLFRAKGSDEGFQRGHIQATTGPEAITS